MSYEAQVYLYYHQHGWLPKGTIYELDAGLALMLLSIDDELNGGQSDGGE